MNFINMAAKRRRRAVGGPLTLSEQVESLLSGTTGFALDPSDTATMWQDTGTATPVTATSDPVGHIRSKWGTTTYDFIQATGASRPAWDGGSGLSFDGIDDHLEIASTAMLQDKPAVFVSTRSRFTAVNSYDLHISTPTAANHRLSSSSDATGVWAVGSRILDATGTTFVSAAAGTLVAGNTYTLSRQVDYAGTRAVTGWKDSVSVLSGTVAGTASNTSNTASATATIGAFSTGTTSFFSGKGGRMVFCPFLPSAAQILSIEGWVAEGVAL